MIKQTKSPDSAALTDAVLRLAARQGWGKLTLDSIAKAAHVPAITLKKRFASVNHLIPVMAEEIDRRAFAAHGATTAPPTTTSVRDRLFDLMMARFDILQTHRAALESMATAARHDRVLACHLSRAAMDSAYRLITAAKIPTTTPPRPVIAVGLIALYGWAFAAWRKDTSRDMAKTMAALDRGLGYADNATGYLNRAFHPR